MCNFIAEIVQIFIECNNRHNNFCVFVLVVKIIFRIVNMCDFRSGLPFLFEVQKGLTNPDEKRYQSASKINTVKDIIIIMLDRNIDTKTGGTMATTTQNFTLLSMRKPHGTRGKSCCWSSTFTGLHYPFKVKSTTNSAKESCRYENLTVSRYDYNIESNIIQLQQ